MTAGDFIAAFPVFAETPAPDIERIITAAAPDFDVVRWGGYYARGLANYVAHFIAIERSYQPGTLVGSWNAISKTVGSVTVSRSAERLEAEAKDPFQRTPWGQEYRRLARLVGMGMVAI